MRKPLGSSCLVAAECRMPTRNAIPTMEVMKTSNDIAQGLRNRDRRTDLSSISRESSFSVPGAKGERWREDVIEDFEPCDAFLRSDCCQLMFCWRLLLADCGLVSRLVRLSALGCLSWPLGAEPLSKGTSTGESSLSSVVPDERLFMGRGSGECPCREYAVLQRRTGDHRDEEDLGCRPCLFLRRWKMGRCAGSSGRDHGTRCEGMRAESPMS